MKVKVTSPYYDKVLGIYPEVGSELDVDEDRKDVLVTAGVVKEVKPKGAKNTKNDAPSDELDAANEDESDDDTQK